MSETILQRVQRVVQKWCGFLPLPRRRLDAPRQNFTDEYSKQLLERTKHFSDELNAAIFSSERRYIVTVLPWFPLPGGKCPYCGGFGGDASGPGSWTCNECRGTGTLPISYFSNKAIRVSHEIK